MYCTDNCLHREGWVLIRNRGRKQIIKNKDHYPDKRTYNNFIFNVCLLLFYEKVKITFLVIQDKRISLSIDKIFVYA